MKTIESVLRSRNIPAFRYVHLKRDGHFTTIEFPTDSNDRVTPRVYSRLQEITDKVAYTNWYQLMHNTIRNYESNGSTYPLAGLRIYGELFVDGQPASQVTSFMKDQRSGLSLDVFEIEIDQDITFDHAQNLCHRAGLIWCPGKYIEPGDITQPSDYTELIRYFHQFGEIEGYVLKTGQDSRYHTHAKYKPIKTIDLFIYGSKPGKGKYAGMVGSLCLACTEGKHICNVSGMTDEYRQWFTDNIEYCKTHGMVVEVTYDRADSAGGLRFPRFLRIREDKTWESCSYTQDPTLAEYYMS